MKKMLQVLKRDMYLELLGIPLGVLTGIIINHKINNVVISIVLSILISIILIYLINKAVILWIANVIFKRTRKDKYMIPSEIRGCDSKIDAILDLDKELTDFLEKYASGKKTDLTEKELNKQWDKKKDYFMDNADAIFSAMDNGQLLMALLSTEQICNVVDIFSYFKPFMINIDYFLEHPDELEEVYYETLVEHDYLKKYSINKYYYERIKNKNFFEEIERFILSNMSNEQIMKLAHKSDSWNDKLYYYGYLKKENKANEEDK